jgi:NAD(P)-dependent dehydrogenase (short-subunit alcohol dehydrogenase family)
MAERIALVTGASKSIGFEVARQLARRGMVVYLGSRNEERGRAASEALREEGDVRSVALDTTDETTMRAALETIEREHGRLDVLVNNAGAAMDAGDAVMADPERIRLTFETNVHGPARLLQLATPLLRKSKAARVVNVSSGAARYAYLADPEKAKPYAYCLSKVAMNGMTALFADALRADGVKVNAANPGHVYSALSAFKGVRTPEQGAEIIVRLATLDDDGPTGGFFDDQGPLSW